MNKFLPVTCTHHFLNDKNTRAEIRPGEPAYVVIWWNDVPLGEIYLSPSHHDGITDDAIVTAVQGALRNYGAADTEVNSVPAIISFCAKTFNPGGPVPATVGISLVICTRDRAGNLHRCLESIKDLKCKPAEIIVVDNASRDHSTRMVAEAFDGVTYVREDRPGLDIARNTGARKATMPVIAYTDDDTIIHPSWILNVKNTFENESASAMTGLVLAAELTTEAQWIFEKHWPFNRGFSARRYDASFLSGATTHAPPVWDIGAGANMAFRRETFAKSGFFDERLDVGAAGCNGDSEIWYRILEHGGVIVYNPRAVVFHTHRSDIDGLKRQIYFYMRGFTAAILIQYQRFRHKGNLRHLFIVLPRYYAFLIVRGFPKYRGRFTTIFQEMAGILSGLIFYLKNRNNSSNI